MNSSDMPHFSGSHTRYSNWYHIVWIPKFRHKLLTDKVRDTCEIVIRDLLNQKDLKLQILTIDLDHVHILVAIPPKYSISQVIQELKSITALVLKRECLPQIRKYLWKDGLFWAKGFYCNTVGGLNIDEVEKYIKNHQSVKKNIF